MNHEKKSMKDYLLNEKNKVIEKLENAEFDISKQSDELLRIRIDIEKNITQIVNNIDLKPFTDI